MSSVLKVDNIEKYYGSKANLTKAIDRISFEVESGKCESNDLKSISDPCG